MKALRNVLYSILRKSEGVLKVDMIYLTRGGFWVGLQFLMGTIVSIVSMIAFGNLLPKESYGIYSYLLSLAGSLGFLTLSGAATAVARAVALGKEEVLPTAFKLQIRYNLLATATIGSAAIYYLIKGNNLFAAALSIMALTLPMAEAYHSYEQILTGRKRFDLLALSTITTAVATTALMVSAMFFTKNILILISIFSFMSLIPGMIIYYRVTSKLSGIKPSIEAIKEFRKTSFNLTGAGLIGNLALYIDKIILFQVAGPIALATYGFSVAGPERLKGFIKNCINIAFPKHAERSMLEIKSVFYQRLVISAIIGFIMSGAYIILSPFLFTLLLPRYLDSILYSQAYSLILILAAATIYVNSIFLSKNMLRAVYFSTTGIQLMRIGLFVLFGWLWGIWGLIFASIFSYALSLLYSIFIWEIESKRIMNLK